MSLWGPMLTWHEGTHFPSAYSAWLVKRHAPGHPFRLGYRLTGIAVIVLRRRKLDPPPPGWFRRRAGSRGDDWQMAYNRLLSFSARRGITP